MSFLQNALSAVKKGIAFEDTDREIDKAILAYQEAILCFQEVTKRNELRNKESKEELLRQLDFYINKVQKLKLQSCIKMVEEIESDDDKELVTRILSTMVQEKPKTTFCDVAGLDDVKESLKQAVMLPIKHPELFSEDVSPYKGFLLFGATGTGKSYLARGLSSEAIDHGCTFFFLSPSDLLSQYEGQSEKLIKTLFKTAKLLKPSVIFIDEVDSLLMAKTDSDKYSQRSVASELRIQMDSLDNSGVFVLAATRDPQSLDDAFLRRFDKLFYVPLPNEDIRFKLFQMQYKSSANISEKVLRKASVISEGLSGSDISNLVKKTKMMDLTRLRKSTHFKRIQKDGKLLWRPCSSSDVNAVKTKLDNIPPHSLDYKLKPKKEDVMRCVKEARPTVNKAVIRNLEQFADKYGEISKELSIKDTRDKKSSKFLGYFNKVLK